MSISLRGGTDAPVKAELVETTASPLGATLVNPYRTNKPATSSDLVDLASQIQQAGKFTKAGVTSKLQVIADQVRFLQMQAKKVLDDASRDTELHTVACNFIKQPGTIYHLYQRESSQRYFSVLSPEEWGGNPPHKFLGSYRLEADQSWTAEEKLPQRDRDLKLIEGIVASSSVSSAMGDSFLSIEAPVK